MAHFLRHFLHYTKCLITDKRLPVTMTSSASQSCL